MKKEQNKGKEVNKVQWNKKGKVTFKGPKCVGSSNAVAYLFYKKKRHMKKDCLKYK